MTVRTAGRPHTAPRRWIHTGLARAWDRLAPETLALLAILAVATLTGIPRLLTIPAFTDEVEEIALGLAILRDGARPLTNVDPYIGPLWNYLLAGAFWLLGPSILLPRAIVLGASVVTVLFTVLLGRILYDPRVALMGGLLLGTSAIFTAVNGHVAWSACVTPLFTTSALLVLALALRDGRPRLTVPAGLLFGLAFHTHPSAVTLMLGAALTVVAQRPRWLTRPWPYLAGLVALAANLNLVIYNLQTGGRTFRYAREIQASYVQEAGVSNGYVEHLGSLLDGLARLLGSVITRPATSLDYLREPALWVALCLTLAGLTLAIRRQDWLGVLVVGATVVAMPLFNPKYEPVLNSRYLSPLLPICSLWMARALVRLTDGGGAIRRFMSRRLPASPYHLAAERGRGQSPGQATPHLDTLVGLGPAIGLAALLVVGSLAALDRYYDDVQENARTGERILEVARTARTLGARAQPVILDERLDKVALGPGAGMILRVLKTTLDLEGVPHRTIRLGQERPAGARPGQLVVLASRNKPKLTRQAIRDLDLRSPHGGPPNAQSQAALYGLYRFGPAPPASKSPSSRPDR
ncbi:MAG: glycosyltransferase family 39 protein [Chloroflexi bacterium]|nr:glycosyltransferase family 39 protein [Chloroflexota bacterium]